MNYACSFHPFLFIDYAITCNDSSTYSKDKLNMRICGKDSTSNMHLCNY
jgi:hypothetical protein